MAAALECLQNSRGKLLSHLDFWVNPQRMGNDPSTAERSMAEMAFTYPGSCGPLKC
jgi:hypothetical protein